MHGIIFLEIKKYADTRLGTDAWPKLLESAGLKDRIYLPLGEYPDKEVVSIMTSTSHATGTGVSDILLDFGEFIVPDLLAVYRSLIDKRWKTLDALENTEKMIHKVVRIRNPGARPPELKVTRRSAYEVVIVYESERRMCSLARGIIRGIAGHYGEAIQIGETTCMHAGAPSCTIHVRLI